MELRRGRWGHLKLDHSAIGGAAGGGIHIGESADARPRQHRDAETLRAVMSVPFLCLNQPRGNLGPVSFVVTLSRGRIACFVACLHCLKTIFTAFTAAVEVLDTFSLEWVETENGKSSLTASGGTRLKAASWLSKTWLCGRFTLGCGIGRFR